MSKPLVLIVDDEDGIRESLSDIFTDEDYRVQTAASGEQALELLGRETPDLVLLDVWLPGIDGLQTLKSIKDLNPDVPVVMISGHGNIEMAVRSTKDGAYDFLEKPLSLERVLLVSSRAMERKVLEVENRSLRQSVLKKWVLVGESPPMLALKEQVAMVARGNARVLITGESGTGKEVVARQLHAMSQRAQGSFVEVNCAAIPRDLIESELFGHERGSFTGAHEQKKGKFELADGGTLFLDEIADMSPETQAKLLRVIEIQKFQRVGGSRNINVDVRVIAATNKSLPERVREGFFRDDLYFRLNVVPINTPPLRERPEDIPLLVEHFLGLLAEEYGQAPKKMAPAGLLVLQEYHWPGNIRELRNLIERLIIMSPSARIEAVDIPLGAAEAAGPGLSPPGTGSLKEAREAFECELIRTRLREHGHNVTRTARALGIERSNLHRKIKAYGINLD